MLVRCLLLVLCMVSFPSPGFAGSPYQPEIGTASSNGTAGAANPTNVFDASALRTNPAGLARLQEPESLFVGGQILSGVMRFDADIATAGGDEGGNVAPLEVIPAVFYGREIGSRWHLGAGLAPAYGLSAEYGDSFVGRYQTVTTRLSGAGVYFSSGYELNEEWALGLSLGAIYTTLELSRAVSNTPSNPNPATDGKVTFDDIDDWSPQATLGILYTPKDSPWTVGLVYRSKTAVDLKGDLEAKNLPFPSGRAEVSFDMPEANELGLAYQYTEKLEVFVQADYQLWSQFSDYTVNIGAGTDAYDRGWRDSYRVALGAQFELTPQKAIFVGTSYDMSPVTDKASYFRCANR